MKAISNIDNGTIGGKYTLPVRQTEAGISFTFLYSDALDEIENGIKETMAAINRANLGIALAFAKIDREALYVQAGCKSYLEYLETAEVKLNMSRQTISDYKRIGEIYLTYKGQLQNAGFKEEGHLHKLRFLPRALESHPAEEVFKRIAHDSLRKFMNFAKSTDAFEQEQKNAQQPEFPVKEILIDGHGILQIAAEPTGYSRDEIATFLKKIFEIKAKGNHPHLLDLYDEAESRAIDSYLKRLRSRR